MFTPDEEAPTGQVAGGERRVGYASELAKRRWPRKPRGERGAYGEALTKRGAAGAFTDAPTALRGTTTAPTIEFGVLEDEREVRVEAVER